MQLAHIGLKICCPADIDGFYIDLMGMTLQYEFVIPKAQAENIFGVSSDIDVCVVQKDSLALELFHVPADFLHEHAPRFEHVCLFVADRTALVAKAQTEGFRCDVFAREKGDLIFIFDKSGNRFEIKQTES